MSLLTDKVAELTAQVKANTDVTASASALISGLVSTVQAGVDAGSLQQVQDAIDAIKGSDSTLASAVASGTTVNGGNAGTTPPVATPPATPATPGA